MRLGILTALLVGAFLLPAEAQYANIVFNRVGQPIAGAKVAICTADPGSTTPPCASLATTYTTVSYGTACVAAAGTGPTSGAGCSNPGLSDAYGNYIVYAPSAIFYAQIYGTGITTQVIPFIIGTTSSSFVDLVSAQTVGGVKNFSSALKLTAITAPTCVAGFGFIWEDSSNTLKWCDNGGAAQAINGQPFTDATAIVKGSVDATKLIKLTATGNTAGVTGTIAGAFTTAKTVTLPDATDTLTGKATTDTLTNKTYDTAGTGNVFKINGQQIASVSGNVSKVGTVSGSLTASNCVSSDANGNLIDAGVTCGAAGYQILNKQDVIAAVAGNSADQTIYTYSMPSGTLAAGKCLRIVFYTTRTVGAGAAALKIFFGATAISNSSLTTGTIRSQATVCNNGGSTTAQWGFGDVWGTNPDYANLVTTPAENTNSGSAITIKGTFNIANTSSYAGKGWIVEMLP